jgi:uncharacterized membrane protein
MTGLGDDDYGVDYLFDWSIQSVGTTGLSDDSFTVSPSEWVKGIALSILASLIGGASKLAIRKSWLLQHEMLEREQQEICSNEGSTAQCDSEQGLTDIHDSTCAGVSCDEASNQDCPNQETIQDTKPLHSNSLTPLLPSLNRTASFSSVTSEAASSVHSVHGNEKPLAVEPGSEAHSCRCLCHACFTSNSKCGETMAQQHSYVPFCLRTLGMIGMTTLNPLCCVMAMNYASPSILAPFSGLTLVWIILLSGPLLGERPTTLQICAVTLIIAGETIVAIFGDHTNTNRATPKEVVRVLRFGQIPDLPQCGC